jgi:peptidoglycan/xylan/chitin deacetylase (PgdA/CDA1 family)
LPKSRHPEKPRTRRLHAAAGQPKRDGNRDPADNAVQCRSRRANPDWPCFSRIEPETSFAFGALRLFLLQQKSRRFMNTKFKVPVLTYHSAAVGADYPSNNLLAFREDLFSLTSLGYHIVSLRAVADAVLTGSTLPEKPVALSLDDGSDFDYHDLPHPRFGMQRSILNSLADFARDMGRDRQPALHATSFVIVSPQARKELDERVLIGTNWWRDDWWADAVSTTLMGIASHSWDHNHPASTVHFDGVQRGTFTSIASQSVADFEIRQAQEYLVRKAPNPATALFAYPYGESNEYLQREYFPRFARDLGLIAAFGTAPAPITPDSPIWNLPRYVFGHDWKTPADLLALLRDAA